MTVSRNVARTVKGTFANRGHRMEAATRDAKRIPTVRAEGVGHSVGTRTGTLRLGPKEARK